MARYEIVGLYDCPWYAKAEKLAEELQMQFSNIEVNKIPKDEFQWKDFIIKMKDLRDWEIKSSPVIWEILVEPHGKVNLIGGVNEFCEYVQAFFGMVIEMSTVALNSRVKHNRQLFEKGFHGQDRGDRSICNLSLVNGPIKLVECFLTQLLSPYSIASPNILFNIAVYNEGQSQRQLEGLCMETVDLCSRNLFRIGSAISLQEVMYNSHLVIILDDFQRQVQENIPDWLNRIEWTTIRYAENINEVASDYCRVIVGGDGPGCYVAEVFSHMVSKKKVRSGHIVSVGQQIITRAKSEIGRKCDIAGGCIGRLYAYGWPGSVGAFVEVRDGIYRDADCSIQGPAPCEIPLAEIALNPDWLFNSFSRYFLAKQKRQIENTEKVKVSSMCQAETIVNLLHIWFMSSSRYGPVPRFSPNEICCPGNKMAEAGDLNNPGAVHCKTVLPVISVGIKCSKKSSFPRGTFMVQPAVCYKGKWISAGIVSPVRYPVILKEVNKLWNERQKLIFRDFPITGVISDYDLDLTCTRPRVKPYVESDFEIGGEFGNFGDLMKLEEEGEGGGNENEEFQFDLVGLGDAFVPND